MRIPTYNTDQKVLVQVIETIVRGQKVIKEIPLRAYQTIQTPVAREPEQ